MLSKVQLVYPPVSNQEAEWLLEHPEAEAQIRKSDLYMIAQREEVTFDFLKVLEDFSLLRLGISTGNDLTDQVWLDPNKLAERALGAIPEVITSHVGPKHIAFYAHPEEEIDEKTEPFEWFTVDKLIYDRGRGLPGLSGLNRWREFATYELLYVGIAKTADTFERLFEGAHHARQRILS